MLTDLKKPLFVIRIGLALVFLFFGIDKFINPFIWIGWVPKWLLALLPISQYAFIYTQGAFQVILGIILLLGFFTRIAAIVAAIFMAAVVFTVGFNDLGIRDTAIFSMALALALSKNYPLSLDSYIHKKT